MSTTNIIDFAEARDRLEADPPAHPIARALDALALALVEHGHRWTDEERELYETAISYVDCKASDWSA